MQPKIFLFPQPLRALREIYRYSKQEWGKTQAERYLGGMRQHFASLPEREKLGLSRPWKQGSLVFKSRYERHLIFYRHQEDKLQIGLIVHGTQDFAKEVDSFESGL